MSIGDATVWRLLTAAAGATSSAHAALASIAPLGLALETSDKIAKAIGDLDNARNALGVILGD
jgi:hypothetical protein